MNFNAERTRKVVEIEEILRKYLPDEEGYQKKIMEAMEYNLGGNTILWFPWC